MQKFEKQVSYSLVVRCVLLLAIATASCSSLSFQVLPKVSDADRALAKLGENGTVDQLAQFAISGALPMIKNPVHEAITLKAVGCDASTGREKDCVVLEAIQANRFLLYGVRWPDDPPFLLDKNNPPNLANCNPGVLMRSTSQPKCWLGLFNDAGIKAKKAMLKKEGYSVYGPGYYLLYRSHYGDLQFFHSMASYDGERAIETQKRMKMWAQFLWGIAMGQVPTYKPIRTLGFDELTPYFPGDITATNLFATGIVEVRKNLDKVALGVLLHMVQDSFSHAHADRAQETGGQCEQMPRFEKPGRIKQFYSYAQQVGHMHDKEDTFESLGLQTWQTSPNVVDVSRDFVTLWNEKVSWEQASKFFDCVFDLQDPDVVAGPGGYIAKPETKITTPNYEY